jgi:hypothetical protein
MPACPASFRVKKDSREAGMTLFSISDITCFGGLIFALGREGFDALYDQSQAFNTGNNLDGFVPCNFNG